MADSFISSLHIQKLGHNIAEIRIRALNHIISKLDHGSISNNDFSRNLDLLKKLFEWFDFEPQTEEEKVLNLIDRILKSDDGVLIVKHIGTVALFEDLNTIRSKIKEIYHYILDKIIEIINMKNNTPGIVPPLITDFPLSYRSEHSDNNTPHSQVPFTQTENQDNVSVKLLYYNDKMDQAHRTNNNIEIETPASTICGLEVKSSTASGAQSGKPYEKNYNSFNTIAPVRELLFKSIPFVTLKWQPLGKSDCHVLKSVEESLQRPPQPSVLIHSCDFFCNVMLQDFPAEVFLQRPVILSIFYNMIYTSPSTRITNAALICLNKLSENLIIRIQHYSDPCTYSLKQGLSLMYEPDCSASARKGFFYNIDLKNIVQDETGSEDSSLIQCNQIPLPQYCMQSFICVLTYMAEKPQSFKDSAHKKKTQSGMNTALQLIDKLTTLIAICIKPSIWDNQGDSTMTDISKQLYNCLEKIGDVLEQYRLLVVASDMEYFERMAQLFLLHSTSHLLIKLIPITKANRILPRSLKNALSSSLLDASFGRLYPGAHEALLQYVNEFKGVHDSESLSKYKDVKIICKAMTEVIPILKSGLNCFMLDNIYLILNSLPSLEFHKNLNIINTFLKICVKNNILIKSNDDVLNTISEILVSLLSHVDKDIREETYSLCQKLIANILGLNHTKHMSESDPGSQIVFFLHSDIIIEIAAHGLTNNTVQIQTDAEDILIHLLKCKYLVSESVWKRIIGAVMLAIPILQCYADYETPLGKSIVKILDPDISPSLFIPLIDIIKGNLRMLFCKDKKLRNEAVSRLCWLLTTEDDALYKVPKIKSLDDFGLSYIFQIDYPIDINRKRSTRQFYQVSSMLQVIDLLKAPSIEPSIRRSALTQISVMLEDHFLHPSFLDADGLNLILTILENSLHEKEYHDYPDSVVPIIAILKNICLYNSVLRQELAHNIKLIFNVLRSLFLYCTDKRMQNDGAMLCCLLLFCEFAIYNFSGLDVAFSLPDIIVQKFNIPFKCNTHWKNSRHSKSSLTGLLMSDDWCRSILRMHWNLEWYGGVSELITWPDAPNINDLSTDDLAEFSVDLRLKNLDLKALKASSIEYCCQQYLLDIENSTTHQSVLEAVRGITGYIALWLLANKSGNNCANYSLLELPWNSSFFRFLSAPPANHEDQNLLVELLRCLTIMLKLYKNSGKICWIADVLQDTAHYLSRLLKIDINNEHRFISMELLTLIADCSTLEQNILDSKLFVDSSSDLDNEISTKPKNWLHIIQIITENLKYSDTEQFYNLAYLDKLLFCIVQITSNLGWTQCEINSIDFHKVFPDLIEAISELLTAFHYGKGTEAASSFMGLNITRNSLLTLNHLLFEMQHTNKKNWENYWVNDTICSSTVFSLFSLWSCRDVIVRAATLQLLSGLATSPRGATIIVENVRHKSNNVWETTLKILLDHTEASVVREHAAILLTNLTSHVNVSLSGQVTLPLCHAPITSKKDISSIEAVLLLLKEYNFFEEIEALLSCLYVESTFDPSIISVQKSPKSIEQSTSRSYVQTSSSSKSSENDVNVFVTPSLVKAVANFLSNLMYLNPTKMTTLMLEHELIRGLFRCLTPPTMELNNDRQFLLYSDILQMCSAVCSLLTRSVLVDFSCRTAVLHTRDCLHILIYLLNANLYNIHRPHFLYLRNQLWSEIFRLITALLEINPEKFNKQHNKLYDSYKESYDIISSVLMECGHTPFINSICESIESKTGLVLQKSALQSLTSLLSVERILTNRNKESSNNLFSLQTLFDCTKTPRSSSENVENIDPESARRPKIKSVSEKYIDNKDKLTRKDDRLCKSEMNIMIGEDLCKTLLKLYELQSIETLKDNKRKSIIIGTLSSLLNVSNEAKKCALSEGFLFTVLKHLKNLHVELSMHSAESLRRISDKKKVCPILKEVDSLFCLLANFLSGNEEIKKFAANSDLADIVHKYWVWFGLDYTMLVNILKLLCTFTTSEEASHSLTLTNPAPGSGPRKVATNISLLNALINLIVKEMDLVNRKHDIIVLQLTFHIMQNACSINECRTMIVKSNLFQSFNKLHPAITKRQKPWDYVEELWLQFFEVLTYYPEGQVHVAKSNDILDLLITITNGQKAINKLSALSIIRNIAFHQSNKVKLLSSVDFIQMLLNKLNSGTTEEKNIVISIIWVIAANSQRSKIALKCAGLDTKIQELIKIYEMQEIQDKSYENMVYVLAVLKEGEK